MPDHFSEDEARRIFARAAQRQHARTAPAEGLTLAELQEIGRSVGLDPAHVAAAASEADTEAEGQATWHGVPVGARRARLLPARVSDAEWERIVDLLRAEFKTPGAAQQVGRRREWATVAGSTTATRVTVEGRSDGDLVTVEAPSVYRTLGYVLGGTFAGIGVTLAALVGLVGENLLAAAGAAGALLGLAVLAYGALLLSAAIAARKTPARFDALLDRIDLASRVEDGRHQGEPDRVGRLDLDALADAEPERDPAAPVARRVR